jgi:hypothetical protein
MNMPAVRLPVLKYAYKAREGKDLERLLEKELKGQSWDMPRISSWMTSRLILFYAQVIMNAWFCKSSAVHLVATLNLSRRRVMAWELMRCALGDCIRFDRL